MQYTSFAIQGIGESRVAQPAVANRDSGKATRSYFSGVIPAELFQRRGLSNGLRNTQDLLSNWWSMVIGACAGALAVIGARLLDQLHINFPPVAWSNFESA
jgi:hypothetical protein